MNDKRFDKLTRERQLEIARMGAQKSAKVRREKKQMRERLEMLLDMTLRKGIDDHFDNIEDSEGKNLTVQDKILLEMIKKAMTGDINAATFLRDTSGQKPVDKQEIKDTTPIFIKDDMDD